MIAESEGSDIASAIWVVLPVYNEGAALLKLLEHLHQTLQGLPFKIVLVNDGSTDAGLETLSSQDQMQIISHPINQGLGQAILSGFQVVLKQPESADSIIIVMDADGTHDPADIPLLVHQLGGSDVVIASRYQLASRVVGLSVYRQILSHGASWLFRLFHPIPGVKDYTCGFRAYRASILHQAFNIYQDDFITEKDFTCMAEILIQLSRLGATFQEVPFTLRYDAKVSTSKMKVLKTVFRSLLLLRR